MNLRSLLLVLRYQGVGWALYRGRERIAHWLHRMERRAPMLAWSQLQLADVFRDQPHADPQRLADHLRSSGTRFLFDPADRDAYAPLLRAFDADEPDWATRRLEEIESGRLSYFSNPPIQVGFPPKWNDNLFEKRPGPPMIHFSHIDEFGYGDVKCIWEPSRFGFAFDLVRIYWRTGDEQAAELFWRAVEDWFEHNPPNTGVNWKCGQEASLRAMAWCFGLWGFAQSEHSTPDRIAMMYRLMAATARRVEAHITYALSQKNNHGISEAMGLFTIGVLFPELDGSERWIRTGRQWLEQQARELIYDDGGFSQSSVNYHRVMLHDCLYAIRIGDLNGYALSEELKTRVDGAGRFVEAIQDRISGSVPRYGQDDGALVLPLTGCDYDDFRPVVQSVAAVMDRPAPWATGAEPWNEEAVWLCGVSVIDRPHEPPPPTDFRGSESGCHILRSERGFAMIRAGRPVHRVSQLDQLHVDIWHEGTNIALDPGTFAYNAGGVWSPIPFALTGAHNTVMIDGQEQAHRIGRFLILPPPDGRVERFERSPGGHIAIVEALLEVRFRSAPAHIRRVVVTLAGDHWIIIDAVSAAHPVDVQVNWALADQPHEWVTEERRIELRTGVREYFIAMTAQPPDLQCEIARATEGDWRGWRAARYRGLKPALRWTGSISTDAAVIVTTFSPRKLQTVIGPDQIKVKGPDLDAVIAMALHDGMRRIRSIELTTPIEDQLFLQ